MSEKTALALDGYSKIEGSSWYASSETPRGQYPEIGTDFRKDKSIPGIWDMTYLGQSSVSADVPGFEGTRLGRQNAAQIVIPTQYRQAVPFTGETHIALRNRSSIKATSPFVAFQLPNLDYAANPPQPKMLVGIPDYQGNATPFEIPGTFNPKDGSFVADEKLLDSNADKIRKNFPGNEAMSRFTDRLKSYGSRTSMPVFSGNNSDFR